MKRLIFALAAAALAAWFAAACYHYDSDATVGWEPELTFSLVTFEYDVNWDIEPERMFAIVAFKLVPTQVAQNRLFYRLLTKEDGDQIRYLDDSIKKRIPAVLQTKLDRFIAYYDDPDYVIPDFLAESLLSQLLTTFKENQSYVAIDKFTYGILTAPELPQAIQDTMALKLYYMRLASDNLKISIPPTTFLIDHNEQVVYLNLRLQLYCNLPIHAKIAASLLDTAGHAIDSLLSDKQGMLPFPPEGELIMLKYNRQTAPDIAKAASLAITLSSDSTCLSIPQLRFLYDRKIKIIVGLLGKLNIDDVAEK